MTEQSRTRSSDGRPDLPRTGDALQLMASTIGEVDARADHEILYRTRHEDVSRAGKGTDPSPDVDGDSRDVIGSSLNLTGMHAGAYIQAEWPHGITDRLRGAHAATGAVEGGHQAITG